MGWEEKKVLLYCRFIGTKRPLMQRKTEISESRKIIRKEIKFLLSADFCHIMIKLESARQSILKSTSGK